MVPAARALFNRMNRANQLVLKIKSPARLCSYLQAQSQNISWLVAEKIIIE
jgi:hypothetical protein